MMKRRAPPQVAAVLGSEEEQAQFVEDVRRGVLASPREMRSAIRSHKRRSPSWSLLLRMRHHPKLDHMTAEQAFEPVDWAMGVAFEQDDPEFAWAAILGDSDSDGNPAEPEVDFLTGWDKVKNAGGGLLAQAVDYAREHPQPADYFGSNLALKRSAGLRLFLTAAEKLQELTGDKPIFLAVEALADLLDVGPNTVCAYRQLGERYGFLEKTSEARPGRAAEYRFLVSP